MDVKKMNEILADLAEVKSMILKGFLKSGLSEPNSSIACL